MDDARRTFAQTQPLNVLRAQMLPERVEKIERMVANRQHGLHVIMEDVANPHNMFAVARTCDALGIQTLHYTSRHGHTFDDANTGHRSSRGAKRWVDVLHSGRTITDCVNTLKAQGFHIAATVATEHAVAIYNVEWASDQFDHLAVLFGNERRGLSNDAIALADSHITIPMFGAVTSLNVSVAAAITLAEITRQRRASGKNYKLPQSTRAELLERFLRQAY
ncbi:MAG: RNA methyltransferase [Chloroflexota bacterium]